MKSRLRKLNYPHLEVVSDGMFAARDVGNGRLIPVLGIDTDPYPEVDRLIRLHKNSAPGDVVTQWATSVPTSLREKQQVLLEMRFERPLEILFGVVFRLPFHAALVDQIVAVNGAYLMSGHVGEGLFDVFNAGRILAEIPSEAFESHWNKMYPATVAGQFRSMGANRSEAKKKADIFVQDFRKFGSFRMSDDKNFSNYLRPPGDPSD
ncbi:hypothetical protein [Amycolatopsis sp. NBC_01480]|uniref:hypothetical protein n=1 Tax=Amycolatopsis sp. NBC_01480 TaxID=2903562 RepID=UPI002E29327A|nr:hypothetical protein [Amycolatopsis sp. NBC_01480]